MATAPMSADTARLSFAKVAASAGKDSVAFSSFTNTSKSGPARASTQENALSQNLEKGSMEGSNEHAPLSDTTNSASGDTSTPGEESSTKGTSSPAVETNLVEAVKALSVNSPMPSLVVNGSRGAIPRKSDGVEGFSDDPFQRTDSGSELGTKPPSLDGKSITSGTTFALDEKESLRPDDSASVKASEDDDTFSGRGSIVAGSRIGSEAAARAYRAEFYEAPVRRSMQPMPERPNQGMITPQSGSSGQETTDDGKPKPLMGLSGPSDPSDAFSRFYRQTPDEKLLEALESPKDRIFLLRLEKDVIEFVKDSKDPFIDLPPCNSFCRMLTHKLADYYHMTHQVDAVAGAVRIFRTPFCRLPPSLTSISNPPTSGNTPPPTMPAMKIMRRGGDGDAGQSPSKATSETGSDGKEKALSAKEKLSREEREAAYNRARERIFGKDDKGDATPDTEDGNEMSRSSSVSIKDISQSKKPKPSKQRRDDSESFDVRSQYTPFFPQPQMPTWTPTPQYSPVGPQPFNGAVQGNYQQSMPPQFGPPNPQFNPGQMNNGNMQVYSNGPQVGYP
ncbi:R3H domain-containing protein, partial [Lachnellula occidentalis]